MRLFLGAVFVKEHTSNAPKKWTWEAMICGSNRPGHMFAACVVSGIVVLLGVHFDRPWLIYCGLTVAVW